MSPGTAALPRQLPLPFPTSARSGPGPAFFAAESNTEARAWLERPGTWPDGRLLIWGHEGFGKTHLLHLWAAARGERAIDGATLRWPLDPGRACVIDDADLAPEADLLHVLNQAAASAGTVLLAARTPPAAWPIALADLASRLRATLAVRIEPPDDALLGAILLRLCADRQLAVPQPLQALLLARLPRTTQALAEAAARLDRAALADGGRVTRALAVAVMDEMAAMWHPEAS